MLMNFMNNYLFLMLALPFLNRFLIFFFFFLLQKT